MTGVLSFIEGNSLKEKISFIRTRHGKILKDVFFMNALRVLQTLLGLASTYFVVRTLSKEMYGEYHFILNTIGVLTIFSLGGLNSSIMQSVARGVPGVYRKAVPIAFFSSFAASAVLAAMCFWLYFRGSGAMAAGFAVSALLVPFANGLNQWKSIQTGTENFFGFFKQSSLNLLIVYPLVILSVLLVPGSFILPIFMILLVPAVQNIILTYMNFKKIEAGPVEAGSIAYGVKTTFYSSFYTISKHADKLLVFIFLSPASLATYAAADRGAELLRNFVQDISLVMAPRFARQGEYTKALDKALKIFALVYAVVVVTFAFTLLPLFVHFLFGERYVDAIPFAQALVCSTAVSNVAVMRFRFIRSKLDTENYRNIMLITSLARIAFSLVLIPLYGISGAVASTFLYRVMMAIVVSAVMKKTYKLGHKAVEGAA